MADKKNKWPLIIVALIAILGCAVYSGSVFLQFNQGIPEERREFGLGDSDDRSRTDRDRRDDDEEEFQEMATALNLTPEQQSQIREIMSQPREPGRDGGRAERFQQMREILTPEQQDIGAGMLQSDMERRMQRRLMEARESLPENEVRALEEEMQERRRQMEEWRRSGEGPPPFGRIPD